MGEQEARAALVRTLTLHTVECANMQDVMGMLQDRLEASWRAVQPLLSAIGEALSAKLQEIGPVLADLWQTMRPWLVDVALMHHDERAEQLQTPALPAPVPLLMLSDGKERDDDE